MTMYGIGSLPDDVSGFVGDDFLMGGPSFDALANAVMFVESRGNPNAVSPKGAVGKMQIMQDSTIDYARAHGLPTDPASIEALRRDPEKNVDIGRWYLRQQLSQHEGLLEPSLAAYNAGPGTVKNILQNFGGKFDPSRVAEFIAMVPAETRKYIQAVKARAGKEIAPMQQPPDDYDIDQGLANMGQMGQRVAAMRPAAGISALQPQQRGAGISALSPYLQLAQQLMPERQGSGWGDALVNAGAAMMQSRSPDFLGAAGAGLQAGNQALQQRRGAERGDILDRFKLGMQLAQFDQKDAGEWAVSDGVMYNKKTGATKDIPAALKPFTEVAKLRADLQARRITPEEFEAEVARIQRQGAAKPVSLGKGGQLVDPATGQVIATNPDDGLPTGYTRGADGSLVMDPGYMESQIALRKAGATSVNVDTKGHTKEQEAVGKALGEQYEDKIKLGSKGRQLFDTVTRAEGLLEGLQTGALAPTALSAQKYLTALGIPLEVFGNAEQLGRGEAAEAVANQMALQLRGTGEGGGMPGAMSDKDREFLVAMTPSLSKTPQGRALIVDSFKRIAKRQIEESKLAEKWFDEKGTMKGFGGHMADYVEKNPLFDPRALSAVPVAAERGLPPSDAEARKAREAPKPGGIYTPGATIPIPQQNAVGPDRIRAMTAEELRGLDKQTLSHDELKAAADRYEQLRLGGQ